MWTACWTNFLAKPARVIAKESMLELKDIIHQERLATQFSIISASSERIVETMTLRMLALSLATNGETIIMKDRMSRLLRYNDNPRNIQQAGQSRARRERIAREYYFASFAPGIDSQHWCNILLADLKKHLAADEARIDAEELRSYT